LLPVETCSTLKIGIVALYFFVWQIPHFWLLLLLYGSDFKKGGFPVLTDLYSEAFIKRITFALLIATLLIGIDDSIRRVRLVSHYSNSDNRFIRTYVLGCFVILKKQKH
jgi:uncharacterized membrane protein